jgi:cytochrome c biogenesis protein CcmG, thiol:disulfide interchange protein DsbE
VRARAAARSLLIVALVVGASSPGACAESALTPLLKPLTLVEYASRTVPPDFSGATEGARPISLTALRGHVVLVNFWASWCVECRPEMPVLDQLHRELSPRGLIVLGVNAREDAGAVRRYARALHLTFPLVMDRNGRINTLYGVIGLPTTFVVGRDGRAVAFGVGARDWGGSSARGLLDALLAEPAPPRAP